MIINSGTIHMKWEQMNLYFAIDSSWILEILRFLDVNDEK